MSPTIIATKIVTDNSEKYYYIKLNQNGLSIIWTTNNNPNYHINDYSGSISDVRKFYKILSRHSQDPLYQDATSPPILELPEINTLIEEYVKDKSFLIGSFETLSDVLKEFPGTIKLLEEFKDLCDTHIYIETAQNEIMQEIVDAELNSCLSR